MAGIYVNDEGTWKLPKVVWINQGTTWRVCKNVYVNNGGFWQELIRTIDISSSKSNFNLFEFVGKPTKALSLVVNVLSGVEIFSQDTDGSSNVNFNRRSPAFTVGDFPAGSAIIINNNGYISGGGGFGGPGAYRNGSYFNPQINGYNGGDGIVKGSSNNFDITVANTGTIAGGGGGGGGGQQRYVCPPIAPNIYDSGCGWVDGNKGGQGAGITGASRTQGGSPMTRPAYGQSSQPNTATGGFGGALGDDGQGNGQENQNRSVGGAGGKAIGSGIEIAVSGTIIGAVG